MIGNIPYLELQKLPHMYLYSISGFWNIFQDDLHMDNIEALKFIKKEFERKFMLSDVIPTGCMSSNMIKKIKNEFIKFPFLI
jgi:hypothetical protein